MSTFVESVAFIGFTLKSSPTRIGPPGVMHAGIGVAAVQPRTLLVEVAQKGVIDAAFDRFNVSWSQGCVRCSLAALIPDRWPLHTRHAQILQHLSGVNRFVICDSQNEVTSLADVAHVAAID
jgi:hypothetical protein